MKTSIILLAAGKGERFGRPKWSVQLAGKTLLEWSLELVSSLEFEKEVIVVLPTFPLPPEEVDILPLKALKSVSAKIISGGQSRHASVLEGLKRATGDLVIFHNVANPMASNSDFYHLQELLLKRDAACFVGQKNVDTLRRTSEERSQTIDRTNVWRVQTPQGFRRGTLLRVSEINQDQNITDEVSLFENTEIPVVAMETSVSNQKITYPEDIELFEQELRKELLVGIGEDSHAFDTSGTLVLGGMKVEELPKLQANSDGDVILHALFNAISSSMGLPSISHTADPLVKKGMHDSSVYLKTVLETARERGFLLQHVSISLECFRPRIDPISAQLKASLSHLLQIPPDKIGITATSGEGMSPFGKGEGVRCSCIVLLNRY